MDTGFRGSGSSTYLALFAMAAFWFNVLLNGRVEKIAEISFSDVNTGAYRVMLCAVSILSAAFVVRDLWFERGSSRCGGSFFARRASIAARVFLIFLNVPVAIFFTWRFVPATILEARGRLEIEIHSALNATAPPPGPALTSTERHNIITSSIGPARPTPAQQLPARLDPHVKENVKAAALADPKPNVHAGIVLEHRTLKRKSKSDDQIETAPQSNVIQKLLAWIDVHSRPAVSLSAEDRSHVRP